MKQWEVWYAKFPFEENPTIIKERPVIILNQDKETFDCLSVKVTSKEIRDSDSFDTEILHWKDAGLKVPSVARVSKTMNLSKENFVNRKGELHNEDRVNVMNKFIEFINNR